MSSSLLLFVSLLAGAEAKPAVPLRVSADNLADALVFNAARADYFYSQKMVDLDGRIERIVRAPVVIAPQEDAIEPPDSVGQNASRNPGEGAAAGYIVLLRTRIHDSGERDVIIRCWFPASARDRLAAEFPPGPADFLIRGRLRKQTAARESVEIGMTVVMAHVADLVDCELVERPAETEVPPMPVTSNDNR